jgi:diguanylate cyclase (GGDEF)-like protein
MFRKVLCICEDPVRLATFAAAAREAGADPLEAGTARVARRLSRRAHVAIGGGDVGLDGLATLALDRPSIPRIAVVETDAVDQILEVVERVHPWAIVREPANLVGTVYDALAEAAEAVPTGAHHLTRVAQRPDFDRLIADRLTGALNYHYLRLRLDEELERAARYRRPLSLAFIDVDDLRGINDRHGRVAGDFALQQVAGALAAGARVVDRLGRWAGGSFALVLPETSSAAAYGIAERLRADIAARRFQLALDTPRPSARLRLTVSCGIASTVLDGVSRTASLITRTDGALWRAKQSGRNRSVVDT